MDPEISPYSVITITQHQAPTDRFSSLHSETINDHGHRVLLICLVEITNPWNPARVLGEGIWQTFYESYTTSLAKSPLTRFEDALKNVNLLIESSKDRIREPVNASLAIITASEIYFSTTGNAALLYWNGKKLNPVAGEEIADQTFAAVTSGDIQPHDWFIFGNQALLHQAIRSSTGAWKKESASQAAQKLVNQIEQEGQSHSAGLWIATRNPADTKRIITLYTDSRPASGSQPALKERLSQAATTGKMFFQNLPETIKKLFKRPSARGALIDDSSPNNDESFPYPDPIAPPARTRNMRAINSFPYRRFIIPAVFVVLVIVGVVIIRNQFRHASVTPKVSTPTIAELITKTPSGELFTFLDQNLTVSNYQNLSSKQKTTFNQAIEKQGLRLITQETKVTSLPETIAALDSATDTTYLVDSTGQFWTYKTTLTKATQQSLVQKPLSMAVVATNKILLSDQAGGVWLFDGSTTQPKALTLPSNLAQSPKILETYNGNNLYLYQTSAQTIYKAGGFVSDIGNPSSVVPSSVLNFGTLESLAINGQYYGATTTGLIRDFSRNALGKLTIQYFQNNEPISITIEPTSNQLVVARGKYITAYNSTTGAKLSEKVLVTTEPITNIKASSTGKILVAAGKTLYQISL